MLAGWDETMRRWRELTTVIFSRVHDDSSENSSDTMRREQIESLHTPEVRLALYVLLLPVPDLLNFPWGFRNNLMSGKG